MTDQPSLFDALTGAQLRDDAIERVAEHAAPGFLDLAVLAIERVARARPRFIVDAVWQELGDAVSTHEKRAMGAAMQQGRRLGFIDPTDDFAPSDQPQCHANPRRIWASRLYRSAP